MTRRSAKAAATSEHKEVSSEHKEAVIEQLRVLYRDGGMYELVSQLDHALQCAKNAADSGADELTIVAALLHDVGWMLSGTSTAWCARMPP